MSRGVKNKGAVQLDLYKKPAKLSPLARGHSLSKSETWWKGIKDEYFTNSLMQVARKVGLQVGSLNFRSKVMLIQKRESRLKKEPLLRSWKMESKRDWKEFGRAEGDLPRYQERLSQDFRGRLLEQLES